MPNTSREWKNIWKTVRTSSHPNVAYSDPSAHVSAIFYFVIPHPSPSSRVASYFVNCIDAFSLYSLAEGERETEDFACSAYRTASFRVLHIPQTNQRLSSSFLCNRWWTDGISFNEIFSFARLIYFPVNRMSIVFSLPLLNFRDRNCIVSLFHRWSINFNKFSWNERIVTV